MPRQLSRGRGDAASKTTAGGTLPRREDVETVSVDVDEAPGGGKLRRRGRCPPLVGPTGHQQDAEADGKAATTVTSGAQRSGSGPIPSARGLSRVSTPVAL